MLKKDLGLLVLILVVGAVVAIINPRFLSPINLANTANLIGLFGIFSIGQAFVIITGGIELSVGSIIALLGVVFVDLSPTCSVHWPLASVIVAGIGCLIGLLHGLLVTRVGLQPFVVTLCGLLIYRGIARFYTDDATAGFAFGASFPTLEWLTAGPASSACRTSFIAVRMRHRACVMGVVLHRSVFGRYLFAVGKNEEAARYSGIRTTRIIVAAYVICCGLTGARRDLPRHVHALDLAGLARQLLRALRHRRGGARRLLAARRRRLDHRRRPRHHPAAGAAEPRQPARHPELAQLRGDGLGHPDRRARRPAILAHPVRRRGFASADGSPPEP